ncbi:Uncharacterised protein [Flavonifractor plautii]|uniref:Uncharacterized protein n=1 Tax=Flavonifractor plautii TaxID=292800 RepID=A0A174UF46_FLAPL|nr:Uncharacterised protein [Flavonifractor plautii]
MLLVNSSFTHSVSTPSSSRPCTMAGLLRKG